MDMSQQYAVTVLTVFKFSIIYGRGHILARWGKYSEGHQLKHTLLFKYLEKDFPKAIFKPVL